jgi:thiamine-phosphate diphosphorylase
VSLPRLHVVTDDRVLGRPHTVDRARGMLDALGPAVALHVRGPGMSARALYDAAVALAPAARSAGALLVVNGRLDVALAVDAGVQLGQRSIPTPRARALLGPDRVVGYSAHDPDEAVRATEAGADFIVLGTIWPTATHPGRPGGGLELVRDTVARVGRPVVAIGGVTPDRAREARTAGAWGVAAIRGIWDEADPVDAARRYLDALEATEPESEAG